MIEPSDDMADTLRFYVLKSRRLEQEKVWDCLAGYLVGMLTLALLIWVWP